MSREIARILIAGERRADLQREWNSVRDRPPIIAGAIALEVGASQYLALRKLFERLQSESEMVWTEMLDVEYDERDLEASEILSLLISSAARTDADLQTTDDHEILVSQRFREVVEKHRFEGLRFSLVVGRGALYRLVIDEVLGPLSPSTSIVREHGNIGLDGDPSQRLLRFPASSYRGQALARTQELFGSERKFPRLICSQEFYRALKAEGITGWTGELAEREVVGPSRRG